MSLLEFYAKIDIKAWLYKNKSKAVTSRDDANTVI